MSEKPKKKRREERDHLADQNAAAKKITQIQPKNIPYQLSLSRKKIHHTTLNHQNEKPISYKRIVQHCPKLTAPKNKQQKWH